jgi:hypothetical protein
MTISGKEKMWKKSERNNTGFADFPVNHGEIQALECSDRAIIKTVSL